MRILIVGSGAREHAIARALAAEDAGHDLVVAPGNAGIAATARIEPVVATDPTAVVELAGRLGSELVVIGPEAPLVAGVADALRERGIPVFGPDRDAAALEGSKAFAKRIMAAAGVPTGRAVDVLTAAGIDAALDATGSPYVVKADGLAAGKGVLVTEDREAARLHALHWLESGPVLLEEFLSGREVSLFFVSDGTVALPLSPAQDFKRLEDGDVGPNTGGMGAYSPLPWLAEAFGGEEAFVAQVRATIAEPVIAQLAAEGTPFQGLLYCGLVVDGTAVRVIEFNARFGDPETQVVLPRLASPLSVLLHGAAIGSLADVAEPAFRAEAAVGVVLASEGYPAEPVLGGVVTGLEDADALPAVHVDHAATAADGDRLVAAGGRVLTVVGLGDGIAAARAAAYDGVERIDLPGGRHRTDIAEGIA
ncbi:phosphoribosylamine--glycine ligase [Amnibacterium kyonggiense]|uniref:Phosphoribosylamine--glycine ligase n=1 Tax=Amnibacterium kyonggiense TaxID=595671 RepID=A0A4R7FQH0_9MICO|nr:phosphoribosylamine--glycine ligase [Amnibacterium kyonggiense]TDS79946.1 phosphoribosylamine--glycine ligase [Amnibacterium kyonggiense]